MLDLSKNQMRFLTVLVRKALDQASLALMRMTANGESGGIELAPPRLSFMPLKEIPEITGNAGEEVVAIYVGIDGDISGHAMMMMANHNARLFADMLMGTPLGTTKELDEMTMSALSEAGNVAVSGFLNALADDLKMKILPTTPQVVSDMAGAILEAVVAHLYLSSEHVLVIETGFVGEGSVPGHFMLLLDPTSRSRLLTSLEK